MNLVDACFKRPDITVLRLGHISKGGSYEVARIHVGETVAPYITALNKTPEPVIRRTAGNLLLSHMRINLLPNLQKISDPVTKLGRAVVSAEHADGLVMIALTHADNRYDKRVGCYNIVSLVAQSRGDGFNHLDRVFRSTQSQPREFVDTMHVHMGDGMPQELQVDKFVIFDESQKAYVPFSPPGQTSY